MSPRRSSRARTTQPIPSAPPHTSSSSSVSSARTERATRSFNKQSSPQKASTPRSLSSEEIDEPTASSLTEPPQTRRRARELDNDEDDSTKLEDDLDDDLGEEEEEITRCVCGHQEYPGPPSDAGKSREGHTSSLTDSDMQADEAGGLFIQCDVCKVWQHGGCVGIMDEAASPEEYFCEECRKDLHKLMTSPKGQKYSRYLPVSDQAHSKNARKGSVSKDVDKSRDKDRNSRASAESFTKRRSTMNSRATYDEDEVLRKVLEESKGQGAVATTEGGSRKKRSRDESEEVKQEPKRQRTGSRSPTSSPTLDSDDEVSTVKNNGNNGRQKPRGAAARSQREKEARDKERERERTEAANRRKGRVERRRADEPEPSEQNQADETVQAVSTSESAAADTPIAPAPPATSHKKSGRPPQKKSSRLGRNQYTKDLPTPPIQNGISPRDPENHPNSPQTNGQGHDSSDGAPGSKQGRTKNWKLDKLSWNEIRRPAGIMQNYISQRQVELAGEKGSGSSAGTPVAIIVNGNSTENDAEVKEVNMGEDDVDMFKKMSTLQMMDDLSRDLVHWQRMLVETGEGR